MVVSHEKMKRKNREIDSYLSKKRKKIDARFKHPFTCIIAGPSGCGKSTFVSNLIERQQDFVDAKWDYIFVFMGTKREQNPILASLKAPRNCRVEVFEVKEIYGHDLANSNFAQDLEEILMKNMSKGAKGCLIFDDLMTELSESEILVSLFTKFSTHASVSVLNITQNLFFKGGGKRSSDNVTLFRNAKVLVLFDSPLDFTVFRIVAQRMARESNFRQLLTMLKNIAEKYRYVVIRGGFKTPREIRFSSDIFATNPFFRQRVFQLVSKAS